MSVSMTILLSSDGLICALNSPPPPPGPTVGLLLAAASAVTILKLGIKDPNIIMIVKIDVATLFFLLINSPPYFY